MSLPISEHKTLLTLDSSKLKTFQECKRKFFFEYLLGWHLDIPAHDAYFGESFHKAREHQLMHGYDDVAGAYNAFLTHYRKQFHESTDNMYRPKDPTNILNALMKFAEERSSDLDENEVVEIDGIKMLEISGTVPIDEDRVLYYRMDSIMRRLADGKIFSWDHKSTKRFSRFWRDQFYLSLQNGTYTHCLYCQFPIEDVLGVEFCGTCFEYLSRGSRERSTGYHISLERVTAFKSPEQMNTWLWLVNDLYDDYLDELSRLADCHETDAVLMAFPQDPGSCTDYFGCAYHDFCMAWQNPLQQCGEPPLGYHLEFWDPSEMDTTVKKNLEWR